MKGAFGGITEIDRSVASRFHNFGGRARASSPPDDEVRANLTIGRFSGGNGYFHESAAVLVGDEGCGVRHIHM